MADDDPKKNRGKKLARLPSTAKVHKRPLLRPQLSSPHSGPQSPKIIYISTHTPFLSAVKRAEKLLHLADKRAVQSATTLIGQTSNKRKRDGDELLAIAETIETQKKKRRSNGKTTDAREEVILKGTGKAVQKVLELGLWFQQREEYAVRLTTGSVGAVDDIVVAEDDRGGVNDNTTRVDGEADVAMLDTGQPDNASTESTGEGRKKPGKTKDEQPVKEEVPETRVRYTSVLEMAVSLR